MTTKTLMTVTSLALGLAGVLALFLPHELLAVLAVPLTNPLPVLVQLLGVLYLAFALTNWTAKDSAIGGVYARPVSLGNFAHFTIGALTLAKYQLTEGLNVPLLIAFLVYALFAIVFAWLTLVYSGVPGKRAPQEKSPL